MLLPQEPQHLFVGTVTFSPPTLHSAGWCIPQAEGGSISLRNEDPKRRILPAWPVEGEAVAGSEGPECSGSFFFFCLVLHLYSVAHVCRAPVPCLPCVGHTGSLSQSGPSPSSQATARDRY
ncbi:hypothetical protein HJG60_009029 [Phyllostomus discolor]|uniref:Uncharacterized protein n=1 Tax=Phyllostomus discolor TaxID=89673 RepID=A0A834DFK3_9CHIR|nr:hypothetical protein HJG60_009029 [Phyllostomus discolor]